MQNPISLGGFSVQKSNTRILNAKGEGALEQRTVNTRIPAMEGISSIIGDRLKDGNTFEFGDYELLEEVARGGMGVIFRARQMSLNRIVALKVILQGQFVTQNDVRRFHAEAESAACLRHEGIVPVYASGEYKGTPFFSMQLIEGRTLSDLILQRSLHGKDAANIMASLAEAVNYAHLRGVIHRDLKPSNILVNEQGKPIITDFGLAKRTDTAPNLTGTGQIIGTPNYMSPEQASGLNHLTDTRSDIYSLGAILYAMLSGKPPFDAGTMVETLMQVTTEPPAALQHRNRKVDRDLEVIALKCLEKSPGNRYQSAAELKADLSRYLNHEPIKASPIPITTRVSRWCRRNPLLAVLSSILATFVIGLATVGPIIAYRQSKLQQRTKEALDQQNKLAQELRGSTAAINHNLVKIYTERGDAAINAGNQLAALPSYTAALRGSIESGEREWGHRFRVGSILEHAAVPISMWELPGQPTATAISSGKEYVACTSRNGELCLWNTITSQQHHYSTSQRRVTSANIQFFDNDRKLLHTSGNHFRVLEIASLDTPLLDLNMDSIIRAVAIDETNRFCVIGTRNGKVTLIDLESGAIIHECERHTNTIRSVAISSNAGRFISACDDGTTKLFDLKTGQLIHSVSQNQSTNHVEFDKSGEKYLCCSDDNTLLILDSKTGQQNSPTINCSSNVQVARFAHTGSTVATGTSNSVVQIWDTETSAALTRPMKHKNSIRSLEFNADDSLLLSSSSDHTTCVWDTKSGHPICPPLLHSYIVETSFFMPDNCVLTISGDRMIRHWQLPNGTPLDMSKTQTTANAMVVSPDGTLLATGGDDGFIRLVQTTTRHSLRHSINHGKKITCLAMHAENNMLAVGDSSCRSFIYQISQRDQKVNRPGKRVPLSIDNQTREPILSIEFSRDGSRLLVVHDGKSAFVYDTGNGACLYSIEHSRALLNAVFSHDGTRILSASRDGTAIFWNAQSGSPTGIEHAHQDYVDACAISPNGELIATASRDHTAQVLNAQTGVPVGPPFEHNGGVVSIIFSPDGNAVATGSRDGIARIWRLDQIDKPLTMRVGLGRVFLQYSPDGKILFTANEDRIQLWDAVDGKSLGTVLSHNSEIQQYIISPDSRKVLVRTEGGNIKIWNLPSADTSPIHELENRVELVTGYRADFREGLKKLSPRELSDLLRNARNAH